MTLTRTIAVIALFASAGTAVAAVQDINSVQQADRLFNDFTTSTLTVTNNYGASYRIEETDISDDGIGNNFANKHGAFFSADGGATRYDFDYGDSFEAKLTYQDNSSGIGGVEAGFLTDLFGFGFFGGLPNGEIAAFGGTLPFHSFGGGIYTPGDVVDLSMAYVAGSGEGVGASTIEYGYQLNGGGWTYSGAIPFTNGEMGWPSAFTQYIGFGAQFNNPIGGSADVIFSNIMITPAPGAAALMGLCGLAGIRRRR